MDLFDNSLTSENISNHSKKFFKEARSLASLSSPASPDIIHVKEPATVHTQRSATKYRDLFNSTNDHLDSRHIPFLDEGDDLEVEDPSTNRTISTRSQSRSSQQGSSDEDVVEKAAAGKSYGRNEVVDIDSLVVAGILEMKSGRGKKRGRSPNNFVEEQKQTKSPQPQTRPLSQLQARPITHHQIVTAFNSDPIRSSTPSCDPPHKLAPHGTLNAIRSSSMLPQHQPLPLSRPSGLFLPRDDNKITPPHVRLSPSLSPFCSLSLTV
jgi:hypothetical protein